jgi:hypothetical protein
MKNMQVVWVFSYREYYSLDTDYVVVFSKKEDAFANACKYIGDYMDETAQFLYNNEEYEQCFLYWSEEVCSNSEKNEHPRVNVQQVIVQ